METHAQRTLAAVIEIGSTSMRMAIGQRETARRHTLLTSLDLPVGIGRESFTAEEISPETTERCVAAIRRFRRVLDEHGVAPADVRVVATSAVREARNRDTFTDRLVIATGMPVEVLDEVEVSRLTYLAVRPALRREGFFRSSSTLVVEVGGGSTELLSFRKGRMYAAQVHRLGSLRMQRELGDLSRSPNGAAMLDEYVAAPVEQIMTSLGKLVHPVHLVALGGEPRLVRRAVDPDADDTILARVEASRVRDFVRTAIQVPVDDLAREHGISEHQAETLLPALAVYVALAEAIGARVISVAEVSLRDGVLTDMFTGGAWESEFRRQTINSSLVLARKYRVNLPHARAVAAHALRLLAFMRLQQVAFAAEDDNLLEVAALLHEVGLFVNPRSYHKHSLYIIENSEIFGLSTASIGLVARIARYHRRATPKPTHEEFVDLPADQRVRVAKLASILRVADALEFCQEGAGAGLSFHIAGDELRIDVDTREDLTLVGRQLEARGEMFRTVFGLRPVLRRVTKDGSDNGAA